MANKVLNMIFKADTSQAKRNVDDLTGAPGQGGVGGLTGALVNLISPADLAIGALGMLSHQAKQAAGDWYDYAIEVGNLSDMLQISVEDASALQALMERFGVTNDTMVAAFRTMNREGLAPTVENLQLVMETYDSITDGTERMQYAQKMLGEQGIKQLIPMWEQLSEEQKANLAVQEFGVELTYKEIQAARDLEQAQKDLAEAKTNLGGAIAMAAHHLLGFNTTYEDFLGIQKEVEVGSATYVDFLKQEHGPAVESVVEATEDLTQAQALQKAVEAILAGDFAAAAHYRDLADAAGAAARKVQLLMDAMMGVPSGGGWGPSGSTSQYTGGGGGSGGGTYSDSESFSYGNAPSVGPAPSVAAEVRRMVDTLPTMLTDAMERR